MCCWRPTCFGLLPSYEVALSVDYNPRVEEVPVHAGVCRSPEVHFCNLDTNNSLPLYFFFILCAVIRLSVSFVSPSRHPLTTYRAAPCISGTKTSHEISSAPCTFDISTRPVQTLMTQSGSYRRGDGNAIVKLIHV